MVPLSGPVTADEDMATVVSDLVPISRTSVIPFIVDGPVTPGACADLPAARSISGYAGIAYSFINNPIVIELDPNSTDMP